MAIMQGRKHRPAIRSSRYISLMEAKIIASFIHPAHNSIRLFIAFMVLEKHSGFMSKIKVRFFANFREFTKTSELGIEGDTVREILEKICEKFKGLEKILFKDRKLQPYVNIFLNGENLPGSDGLDKSLREGDEIAIFPPVSGG